MKTIIGALGASLVLMALTPAQAWANPQHERMRRCNAEAKAQTLKGEERKAFMSTCLRGRHDAGATAAAVPAPAAVPAAAGGDGAGEAVKAPAGPAAAASAAAATVAPSPIAPTAAAPAAAAPTAAASTAAAPTTVAAADTSGADDKVRAKACNQSASEQSLRGAKRKAFIAECLKG